MFKIPITTIRDIKKLMSKLKNINTKTAAIILAAAGMFIIAISSLIPSHENERTDSVSAYGASYSETSDITFQNNPLQDNEISLYAHELEQKLSQIVSHMANAGTNVKVMITFDSSFENVYAYNAEVAGSGNVSVGNLPLSGDRSSEKQLVLTENGKGTGSQSPVLIKKVYPKVKGVVVVCPGGGNSKVKCEITDAVSALFGIASNRVEVYEANSSIQDETAVYAQQ